MKLLTKPEATSQRQKSNDELLDTNLRLRKSLKDITQKLNTVKDNYDPDKLQRLKEYEDFCKGLNEKKSILLKELHGIESEIEKKKDVYYGLIAKQDLLDEKIHDMKEQEKKLQLREGFVAELERKQRELII